ncbi:hypothetical protein GCM10029964_023490 [Kibdelosporangium lantanae]
MKGRGAELVGEDRNRFSGIYFGRPLCPSGRTGTRGWAVQQGEPYDQAVHDTFPGDLAAAVNGLWVGNIGCGVAAFLGAVPDEVAGRVQHPDATGVEASGYVHVHCPCPVGIPLRLRG